MKRCALRVITHENKKKYRGQRTGWSMTQKSDKLAHAAQSSEADRNTDQ